MVVNYHYIRERFNFPYNGIVGINPTQFSDQLDKLSKIGEFISQADLITLIDKNENIDSVKIMITFDDGLREQYDYAFPILVRKGIPAVFFINTVNYVENEVSDVHKIHLLRSYVSASDILKATKNYFQISENRDLLSEEDSRVASNHYRYDTESNAKLKYFLNFKLDIKTASSLVDNLFELYNSSISEDINSLYFNNDIILKLDRYGLLGCHCHRHLPVAKLKANEIYEEFSKPQNFASELGIKQFRSISYPYGSKESLSREIFDAVSANGYIFGFSMERAVNVSLKHNPLSLARFACNDVPGGANPMFANQQELVLLPIRSWF
ncbi:MAG: polysaccharide deacetylase family protein [Ignavibacteriaceae bacterium]|nr:polysaccharide deacetylase family protein [Ignavibacteriaceae bacterium]